MFFVFFFFNLRKSVKLVFLLSVLWMDMLSKFAIFQVAFLSLSCMHVSSISFFLLDIWNAWKSLMVNIPFYVWIVR